MNVTLSVAAVTRASGSDPNRASQRAMGVVGVNDGHLERLEHCDAGNRRVDRHGDDSGEVRSGRAGGGSRRSVRRAIPIAPSREGTPALKCRLATSTLHLHLEELRAGDGLLAPFL